MNNITYPSYVKNTGEGSDGRNSYDSIGVRDRLIRDKTDIRVNILLILNITISIVNKSRAAEFKTDIEENKLPALNIATLILSKRC